MTDEHGARRRLSTQKAEQKRSQEAILAALALLLGPETDYHVRMRAVRQLSRQGEQVLPLLLRSLNELPELNSPPWPWWPPPAVATWPRPAASR